MPRLATLVAYGRPDQWGLGHPADGLMTRNRRDGVEPLVDSGLVSALRQGRITVLPEVTGLWSGGVVLGDGRREVADVVVIATGFGSDLASLVGHLGVLDERGRPVAHGASVTPECPGLRFVGMTLPISGNLREIRRDAGRIARAVACDVAATGGANWTQRLLCQSAPQA